MNYNITENRLRNLINETIYEAMGGMVNNGTAIGSDASAAAGAATGAAAGAAGGNKNYQKCLYKIIQLANQIGDQDIANLATKKYQQSQQQYTHLQ